MKTDPQNPSFTGFRMITSKVMLVFFMLLLWYILIEGKISGFWFAVPVVIVAMLVDHWLPYQLLRNPVSLTALLKFLPSFITGSFVSGADVAWRVLVPRMPIQPAYFTYSMRLRGEYPRAFLAQVISLMPGTLACDIVSDTLVIHALYGSKQQVHESISRLERNIETIFPGDEGSDV